MLPDPTLAIPALKGLKSFIDDVALLVSTGHDNLDSLVLQAQVQVQWWNQLVHATGGALNPTKCCSMIYTWTPDKLGILQPSPPPHEAYTIKVTPDTDSPTIPVLTPHEGTRYLGLYINQLGTTMPMEAHLWKKAILYTTALQ